MPFPDIYCCVVNVKRCLLISTGANIFILPCFRFGKYFLVTFLLSIAWIAAFSYITVWMVRWHVLELYVCII